MSKNDKNVDELKNLVDWLISEYEEEKRLRIKYEEALSKIEYASIDDFEDIVKVARKALSA